MCSEPFRAIGETRAWPVGVKHAIIPRPWYVVRVLLGSLFRAPSATPGQASPDNQSQAFYANSNDDFRLCFGLRQLSYILVLPTSIHKQQKISKVKHKPDFSEKSLKYQLGFSIIISDVSGISGLRHNGMVLRMCSWIISMNILSTVILRRRKPKNYQ